MYRMYCMYVLCVLCVLYICTMCTVHITITSMNTICSLQRGDWKHANLKSVYGNPRVVRYVLEDWDQELDAPVPMGQEEHKEDQLANPQYTTGHVEDTRKGGEFLGNVMTHMFTAHW